MNNAMPADVSFREVQRFQQVWLWALILGSDLLVVALFGYGLVQQIGYGEPWGDRPMSDTALVLVSIGLLLFLTAFSYLFYVLKLVVEVRADVLYLRFFPLRPLRIPYTEIKACAARTYQPLRDYGGWGIRYGPKGKAYNVRGDQGVLLEFAERRPLLIGSQRSEELASRIRERLPAA